VPFNLSTVIQATAQWLVRAYPAPAGALHGALAEVQARQAATVAAWLRYPTKMDADLVSMIGPGGSGRLDQAVGADPNRIHPDDEKGIRGLRWLVRSEEAAEAAEKSLLAWRTWVDEVVASWAACLLSDPDLAGAAVTMVAGTEHMAGQDRSFYRLTNPDPQDRRATTLLRHPDLVAPVADLHRTELLVRLGRVAEPDTEAA
jgi:hypothetical protein